MIAAQVRESLTRCSVRGGVLIALSGGADSVALLRVLCALRGENGLRLAAAYVNHGLREAAREEEAFCADLCRSMQIPLLIRRVRVEDRGSPEAAARAARYDALRDAMAEADCATLALAHHQDDQAETLLLHLMYGAGAEGLAGMAEYAPPLWRPLLHVSRAEIRRALRELNQDWREDESNADETYTRNYLRARVLPVMRSAFPQAASAMSRAADILREENDYLNSQCAAWLDRFAAHGEWPFLLAEPLHEEHVAMRRRIFRAFAAEYGVSLEYAHTEALRHLPDQPPGAACNLTAGWTALRTEKRIHLIPPARPERAWSADALRTLGKTNETGNGMLRQAVPQALLKNAELRTRRPGDRITPFGMQGSMKLKDYLIARGIDRPFRDAWPLLCLDHDVLWVIGVGASERLRVRPGDPEADMVLFTGELPDALVPKKTRRGR